MASSQILIVFEEYQHSENNRIILTPKQRNGTYFNCLFLPTERRVFFLSPWLPHKSWHCVKKPQRSESNRIIITKTEELYIFQPPFCLQTEEFFVQVASSQILSLCEKNLNIGNQLLQHNLKTEELYVFQPPLSAYKQRRFFSQFLPEASTASHTPHLFTAYLPIC